MAGMQSEVYSYHSPTTFLGFPILGPQSVPFRFGNRERQVSRAFSSFRARRAWDQDLRLSSNKASSTPEQQLSIRTFWTGWRYPSYADDGSPQWSFHNTKGPVWEGRHAQNHAISCVFEGPPIARKLQTGRDHPTTLE